MHAEMHWDDVHYVHGVYMECTCGALPTPPAAPWTADEGTVLGLVTLSGDGARHGNRQQPRSAEQLPTGSPKTDRRNPHAQSRSERVATEAVEPSRQLSRASESTRFASCSFSEPNIIQYQFTHGKNSWAVRAAKGHLR